MIDWESEYRRNDTPLQSWLSGKCGQGLAEDVAAEAWLRAWQRSGSFEGRSTFKAWLFAVAHHCMWEHIRKSRQLSEIGQSLTSTDPIWPHGIDARIALASICGREREIIEMKFFRDISNVDIARHYGMPPETVGIIVFRALRKMRKEIEWPTT